MNKYLIEIPSYFGGVQHFTVEAENKHDALDKARICVNISHVFDNCKKSYVKVVKKLQIKEKKIR